MSAGAATWAQAHVAIPRENVLDVAASLVGAVQQ